MKFWQRPDKSRSTMRKHRISIERVQRMNLNGDVVMINEPVKDVWASVETLSEQQRIQFQAISVLATHRIIVDGKTDIKETDKIHFRNRIFDILTIRNVDERGIDKMIMTQEIRP